MGKIGMSVYHGAINTDCSNAYFMNHTPYNPPNSQFNQDDSGGKPQKTWLKWLTFVLLSLLGIFGLFVTGCGIMFIPYGGIGLLFSIPAAIVCYLVYKGLRTIFSKRASDKSLLFPIFCVTLISILALPLFVTYLYGGFGIIF